MTTRSTSSSALPEVTKYWGAPGTGKTTRLKMEITRLLDNYEKSEIIATTYRKRMAKELRNRLGWDKKEGTIGTLHSICFSLCGQYKVVDAKAQAKFCDSLSLPYEKMDGAVEAEETGIPQAITAKSKLGNLFFDARSYLVNRMLDFDGIYQYGEIEQLELLVPDPAEFMRAMTRKYEAWKQENKLLDFDDMLLRVHEQREVPEGKVFVIDEFQDLSPLQYSIVCMWSRYMEKVIIAGDPRQTLYGYRGASAKFFENHPGKLVVLNVSHRLPAVVWNFATGILERAGLSYPDIRTTNKPGIVEGVTETAYYDRLKAPALWENTMHLVRINEMGIKIAGALEYAGIPFSGIMGWGQSQINLYNTLLKIRQCRSGKTNGGTLFTKDEAGMLLDVYPKECFSAPKTELRRKLEKKNAITFRQLSKWSPYNLYGRHELWEKIADDAVLEDALEGYGNPESHKHIKIIHALKDYGKPITAPTVSVSTIHAAKGGEARFIFLYDGLTKKIHDKLYADMDPATEEAEANVFYVGATRAMEGLFIVKSSGKYHYNLPGTGE